MVQYLHFRILEWPLNICWFIIRRLFTNLLPRSVWHTRPRVSMAKSRGWNRIGGAVPFCVDIRQSRGEGPQERHLDVYVGSPCLVHTDIAPEIGAVTEPLPGLVSAQQGLPAEAQHVVPADGVRDKGPLEADCLHDRLLLNRAVLRWTGG